MLSAESFSSRACANGKMFLKIMTSMETARAAAVLGQAKECQE